MTWATPRGSQVNLTNADRNAACVMPGFHHSVAVLPFPLGPLAVAIAAAVCLGSVLMIGWPATERKKKNSILFQRKNGYGSFLPFTAVTERNFLCNFYRTTEFYNGRTAKRQQKNDNGMVETRHKSRPSYVGRRLPYAHRATPNENLWPHVRSQIDHKRDSQLQYSCRK